MSPKDDDIGTMDRSPTPGIETKISEYKNLMSPESNASPELRTDKKLKRRRRKGNNWTRKKCTLRSPTQTPHASPILSPKIKQEESNNLINLGVKAPGALRNIYDDSNMDIRRAAVEQDFGLRRRNTGTMYKPKVPVKSIEQTEPLLFQETPLPSPAEPRQIAPKKEAPKKEASKKEAPKKGVRSILPTPETPRHDRSLTTSPTSHHEKVASSPNSKSSNICCSCESETGDESPIIPPHFPPNPISRPSREADIFWRDACMEVQSTDEPVHAHDVIVRIMTRKGGIARSWPRLEEGLAAIKMMGKDTIDIAEILRRQEEEEAIAKAKEERCLANKRLYRPRGQIDRERTKRRAALAAQKARGPETDRADDTPE
ncbi:hypothetical protein NXS19_000392 [Fusarium pseudograminearum]|uniref:Uncharacterized protein n=1 Tax=Fusarium pseudograminearum (strain CS3096) TaxID=1028729 RepID=K3VZC3_FUSPC|nr:hypothetical protein FPSE_07688 [Fusarium pseudograminearum CS3096]EKJ72150.1 hypothetical protein FPSE_07688 [Fusarium pseudograminearum CS3096]UZP32576.1 hypothetical protein NXS19_000392 [Fusarium pseudograminearum]